MFASDFILFFKTKGAADQKKKKKKKRLTRALWIYQQSRFSEILSEHFSGKQMILSINKKIKETENINAVKST